MRVIISRNKSSAAGLQGGGGSHAVSKFRRVVNMKITVNDRKRWNTAADFEGSEIAIKSRTIDETKSH